MRLLNVSTFELEHYPNGRRRPAYAILSHTWGEAKDEVSYTDITSDVKQCEQKIGFRKIKLTCKEARENDLQYAWIDTCCIDKTSSAELSEAINSMYQWYRDAAICYAYLDDVSSGKQESSSYAQRSEGDLGDPVDSEPSKAPDGDSIAGEQLFDLEMFRDSRWFTRGWTLQELIAPQIVKFFNHDWSFIGSKESIVSTLIKITEIPKDILLSRRHLNDCSIAKRMSWASLRETTRIEDEAYCLMGIFNVHMPLLYGEGGNAFIRLQKEIIAQSTDQSIFAWTSYVSHEMSRRALRIMPSSSLHYLASSPAFFAVSGSFEPTQHDSKKKSHSLSPRGLEITAGIVFDGTQQIWNPIFTPVYAILDCFDTERCGRRLAIKLEPVNKSHPRVATEFYARHVSSVDAALANKLQIVRPIIILNDLHESHTSSLDLRIRCFFKYEWNTTVSTAGVSKASDELSVEIIKWHPEDSWDPQRLLLTVHRSDQPSSRPVCKFIARLRYTPHSRAALGKNYSEVAVIVHVYYDGILATSQIVPTIRIETRPSSIEFAWNNPITSDYIIDGRFRSNTTPLHHQESGRWKIDLVHIKPSKNDPYGSLSMAVKPLRSMSHVITHSLLVGAAIKNRVPLSLRIRPGMRKLHREFQDTTGGLYKRFYREDHINDIPPPKLKEVYGSRKLWRKARIQDPLFR